MWPTIKKIIISRFKKQKEDTEFLRKKEICKKCEYNSLNMEALPFNKLLLKKLSDFYSYISGKKEKDVLGNCFGCKASCSIYFKLLMAEEGEVCPKDFWNDKKY